MQCIWLFLSTDKKTDVKLMKNVDHVFCQTFNHDVFGWFACKNEKSCSCQPNTISTIPCHFCIEGSNNAFASKAATSAVIVGNCSKDLKYFY